MRIIHYVATVVLIASIGSVSNLSASTITQNLVGSSTSIGSGFSLGQSVTIPTGGPWDALTFNWISAAGAPYAVGTLFLLTQSYAGTGAALSSATPGFVASTSNIVGGEWVFSPAVEIQPSTVYYLFMNTNFDGSTEVQFSGTDVYPGGNAFQGSASSDYGSVAPADLQFQLQGAVVAGTPEPSTGLGMVLALGGFAFLRLPRSNGR